MFKVIIVILTVNALCSCSDFELSVRLYDQPNLTGSSVFVYSSSSVRVCLNLPTSFNDRVASIDLQIPCLVVYADDNCVGEVLSIVESLQEVPPRLKNKISSLQSCRYIDIIGTVKS